MAAREFVDNAAHRAIAAAPKGLFSPTAAPPKAPSGPGFDGSLGGAWGLRNFVERL